MKQLIEEQKEEFIKDFCELKPYRDTDLIYFKGFCDKNYNLIPTPKTILQWHEETIKESLKQFIDELIVREEGDTREFKVTGDGEYHFGENQKVIGWNMAKEYTIAHLKKLKENITNQPLI